MTNQEDSSITRKRKESSFHGRARNYQLDVQFKTKGSRYFIRASGRQEDLDSKEDTPPTKWTLIYFDKQCQVFSGIATRESDFTQLGQKVFFIKFKDGRRLRLYENDFTQKRVKDIQKAIKSANRD